MTRDEGVDWRQHSACGPDTADLFITTARRHTSAERHAIATCRTCPVQKQCHDHTAAHRPLDLWTIAGGVVWRPARSRAL